MQEKHCARCKRIKLLNEFPIDKYTKDKHRCYCFECMSIIRKEQYQKNRKKRIESTKQWVLKNREKNLEYQRNRRKLFKDLIIKGYGGKCTCCGESNFNFLTLEHIKGGGSRQRKIMSNMTIHRLVIKNNFPNNYTILCMNCNWGSRHNKICPHKQALKLAEGE